LRLFPNDEFRYSAPGRCLNPPFGHLARHLFPVVRMAAVVQVTGYYLNGSIPAVALIYRGLRFPRGTWVRVADPMTARADVQDLVAPHFPSRRGRTLRCARLTTDGEIEEFEGSLPALY